MHLLNRHLCWRVWRAKRRHQEHAAPEQGRTSSPSIIRPGVLQEPRQLAPLQGGKRARVVVVDIDVRDGGDPWRAGACEAQAVGDERAEGGECARVRAREHDAAHAREEAGPPVVRHGRQQQRAEDRRGARGRVHVHGEVRDGGERDEERAPARVRTLRRRERVDVEPRDAPRGDVRGEARPTRRQVGRRRRELEERDARDVGRG